MTLNFETHLAADRRRAILATLKGSVGYAANEYIVEAVLTDLGHEISNDKLQTELAWLAEQGLVELQSVGGVTIAKLTQRGLDVARGRARVPGVDLPKPD